MLRKDIIQFYFEMTYIQDYMLVKRELCVDFGIIRAFWMFQALLSTITHEESWRFCNFKIKPCFFLLVIWSLHGLSKKPEFYLKKKKNYIGTLLSCKSCVNSYNKWYQKRVLQISPKSRSLRRQIPRGD